jgi:type IV secretory pathway TrbF-like protein
MVNSSHARNWRTMATISTLVALLATGGMVWLSWLFRNFGGVRFLHKTGSA